MAFESPQALRFQIGHVLFIDIVGYSKLMIDEQREQQNKLNELVRGNGQFRASVETGNLVRLPTGDGMALVFRDNVEAPMRCAEDLSRALRAHPEIQLRMGIHSGPVSDVQDVNENANIAGDGVNIAQRVMDCGDGGHILVSKRVAEDLSHYRAWRSHLHDLGQFEVKHGVQIDLVNFYADDFGNPAVPEKIRRAIGEREARARAQKKRAARQRWLRLGAAALVLLSLSAAGVWTLSRRGGGRTAPNAAPEVPPKSVAVLPFENLSNSTENASLASGMQDEILTRLAKIADLKVIARTSTRGYESKPANLSTIGKELGVATILEGSVQKIGEKMRVTAQLIDAASKAHVWAETYDRSLTDVFAVETEVATQIASALHAALSPEEKQRVAAIPTLNREAYAAYLLAHDTFYSQLENEREIPPLFQRAIALDPGFALAHAELSITYSNMYIDLEATEEYKLKARSEAEEALRLRPDLGEAHAALGSYFYRVERNYDAALREYIVASRALPNDSVVVRDIAMMRKRQGRWRAAVADLHRAISLDPRNFLLLDNLGDIYFRLHEWELAKQIRQRSLLVDPKASAYTLRLVKGGIAFTSWANGEGLSEVHAVIDDVSPGGDPDGAIAFARYQVALYERNYDAAERALASTPVAQFEVIQHTMAPKTYFEACLALARGDAERAHSLFQSVLSAAEAMVKEHPEIASRHAYLGLIYAYLGRKEDAVREGRQAVELPPEATDAADGPPIQIVLATIYARTGEFDLALPLIERLLTTPSGIMFADLRTWWEWDPLRKDPRFQKIVAGPEPKVIYQ